MAENKKKRGKIGVKLTIGLCLFGLTVILFGTFFTSIWFWSAQTRLVAKYLNAEAQTLADYIKGDTVQKYYETRQTDAYYDDITDYMTICARNSELIYYYVIIPREEDYVYVWDAKNAYSVSTLGTVEEYHSEMEKNDMVNAFNGIVDDGFIMENDETYGFLASAYQPVRDSSGNIVAIAGVDYDANRIVNSLTNIALINIGVIGMVTLFAVLLFYSYIRKRIIKPIDTLHKATEDLVTGLDQTDGEPFKVDVHTNDELEDLADSFTQMDTDLRNYITRLEKITAEKEKISAELNVATQIQEDMLPRIFPPFPDCKAFTLYASMDPAREVGGDFYDFFMIDANHLGLVIADVSDKGVPAALFMVIAKTLLKTRSQNGGTPKEILYDVNNQLCEGNDANLFVTVWLAILDITTGKGIAANAGHENPILRRAGSPYEMIVYPHCPPLALMPETQFKEHAFELHPGDSLFVYTDGAPEAMNIDKKQFTTNRIVDTLNTLNSDDPEQMIHAVTDAISEFVKDAPQFDDTTMLALSYYGEAGKPE
jgi:sigma-B regulation protein RsbU (phosphoserine phosphatase)